ncbi:alpha/beta hydrolase [Paraburkholderia sp. BL25I1N1]|uniref:alpha/beta hydrolase n=1 Tax=Paraburkholderia sp. BL25I1N1 TaxID=1938804 RepID=UPI000D051682|nr:alpha/beta hydrolase [Paraburkholderia sp. BL25I1N1]PRY04459.1 acetyl esterase [Paraburkholderia sp. BL25I1N1]
MKTHDANSTKPSVSTQPLLTPYSAHPVLDVDVQSFVDAQVNSGDEIFYLRQPADAREAFARLQGKSQHESSVIVDDLNLPTGPTGSVTVRIARPTGATRPMPIVMYFHGGGWLVGDRHTHDRLIREIAIASDVAVVFVDYSHSPEAVFPRQNEEAYAAMTYVVAHAAALALDPTSVALVGDGAGGNMVAAVAILAKSRRGPAIALQVMFYPVMSASTESNSYQEFENGPWITGKAMRALISAQFPPGSHDDLSALPLNANFTELEGLPAALVITAENDVVRDQGEQYAKKLMQAGVEVTATRYLGTIHDFISLDDLAETPASRAALMQACAALRAVLHC